MTESLVSALNDLRDGRMIIVVDSENREAEGDIVFAADKATTDMLAFTARYARGIMCLPTEGSILDRLQIPMSPSNSLDKLQTPFTVSLDAAEGISTGVSVQDRLVTITKLLDPNSQPSDFAYPGHLFPLRPRIGLLKERQGHTEASITLMNMAGLQPVAVICEIMNDDGTMMRLTGLQEFGKLHDIRILSVDEIIENL